MRLTFRAQFIPNASHLGLGVLMRTSLVRLSLSGTRHRAVYELHMSSCILSPSCKHRSGWLHFICLTCVCLKALGYMQESMDQMRRNSWAGQLPASSSQCGSAGLLSALSNNGRIGSSTSGCGSLSAPLPAYPPPADRRASIGGNLFMRQPPMPTAASASRRSSMGLFPPASMAPAPPRPIERSNPASFSAQQQSPPTPSSKIDWSHVQAAFADSADTSNIKVAEGSSIAASKVGGPARRELSGSSKSDASTASGINNAPFDYKAWVSRSNSASRQLLFDNADAAEQVAPAGSDGKDSAFASCTDPILHALPQDLFQSMASAGDTLGDVTNSMRIMSA